MKPLTDRQIAKKRPFLMRNIIPILPGHHPTYSPRDSEVKDGDVLSINYDGRPQMLGLVDRGHLHVTHVIDEHNWQRIERSTPEDLESLEPLTPDLSQIREGEMEGTGAKVWVTPNAKPGVYMAKLNFAGPHEGRLAKMKWKKPRTLEQMRQAVPLNRDVINQVFHHEVESDYEGAHGDLLLKMAEKPEVGVLVVDGDRHLFYPTHRANRMNAYERLKESDVQPIVLSESGELGPEADKFYHIAIPTRERFRRRRAVSNIMRGDEALV